MLSLHSLSSSSPSSVAPTLSGALSAPFSSAYCTFAATSLRHAYQLWRPCYTCGLVDSNGCCQVCAATCHAGHQLGEERLSNFFCDCGSRGPAFCQCLEEHSDHHGAAARHPPSPASTAAASSTAASVAGSGLGALLSPDAMLDISGGLFAGSPPVDIGQIVGHVLSTNQQLFHVDARPSLPGTVREACVQMHARERLRRNRRKERSAKVQQERPAETRRRGDSFALSAFAACLEEIREDDEAHHEAAAPILATLERFLAKQPPYSMHLPSSQRAQFDVILRRFCWSAIARSPSSSNSADAALRMWLSVGGVSERLEAAHFLVERHSASSAPLSSAISSFIAAFVRAGRCRQRRILRTSRSSHASELSSKAVRLSIDLICSSLALTSPVPSSSAASLASATASTHVSSGSLAQNSGVFPSLTASTDGDFLYFLSAPFGLVKLGAGQSRTAVGELVEQNPWLALHAGGHVVCFRDGERDALLLRSPLLPANRLLRVDCVSLHVVETLTLPSSSEVGDGSAFAFDVEHELVSSTPSASTTPHWQPLAPVLATSTDFTSLPSNAYALIQQCLSSGQWKLGEPFVLSSLVHLVVLAAGIFLVIDHDQQPPIHYRLRLRAQKRPMPILADQRQAVRGGAAVDRFVTFSNDASDVRVQVFALRERPQQREVEEKAESRSDDFDMVEEIAMEDYHHALPAAQPMLPTTAASSISASPSASGPSLAPSSTPRPCDGCGLLDWRAEEEFTCLDGCVGLTLCSWCHLHQRFNSPTHSAHHHMDHRMPPAGPPVPVLERNVGFLRSELASGVLYWDGCRLVLFPPRLPSSTLRHWRDFQPGDIVDVKDIYQKWYQADILAVNPVEKTVMVHYHGWHQKWGQSPCTAQPPPHQRLVVLSAD